MLMKREPYVVPQLSIVEAFVERGFTASIDEWVDDEIVVDWDDPEKSGQRIFLVGKLSFKRIA